MNTNSDTALVVSHGDTAVTAAVVTRLEADGWHVIVDHGVAAASAAGHPFRAVVYLPGLLDGAAVAGTDPATVLGELLIAVAPVLPSREDGGARVVAVSSRDWLGWPSRPQAAAAAAGLIAAVRSLALAHGRAGVTVNAVVGMPDPGTGHEPVPNTHLVEPRPLTGEVVTADDIAGTVGFLVDRRSAYITGQVLHCCGGTHLLSSLSS